MEKNHKIVGGRPKASNPKEFDTMASFTKGEIEKITQNAIQLGITKSEYVSKMTINRKIIDTYSPAQKDLVMRLINIFNNLNQIAKAANTVGFKQVVIEVDELLKNIRNLIKAGR